jgi:coniferyl-aldehyde dehydrogenase
MNIAVKTHLDLTLQQVFDSQLQHFNKLGAPDYQVRIKTLKQLKQQLLAHQTPLVEALAKDYGHRSHDDSLISDILPCINHINYTFRFA